MTCRHEAVKLIGTGFRLQSEDWSLIRLGYSSHFLWKKDRAGYCLWADWGFVSDHCLVSLGWLMFCLPFSLLCIISTSSLWMLRWKWVSVPCFGEFFLYYFLDYFSFYAYFPSFWNLYYLFVAWIVPTVNSLVFY